MTPEVAYRWADEMALSPSERKLWKLFTTYDELSIEEMFEEVYGDLEDGGPLQADNCLRQFMHSLNIKLGDRGGIIPVHRYKLELHPGRR